MSTEPAADPSTVIAVRGPSKLFTPRPGRETYRAADRRQVSTRGDRVRSKSEVIIADMLHKYEVEGRFVSAR